MSESKLLSAADYEDLLALVGELGELAAQSAEAALEHLMFRVGRRLDAASSCMVLEYPEGFSRSGTQSPKWQIDHAALTGLESWQLRYWSDWFIERQGAFDHPMFLMSVAQAGQPRSYSREMLVSNTDWYRNAFVNDCLRQVGFDDCVSTTIPLDNHREVALAVARPWDEHG